MDGFGWTARYRDGSELKRYKEDGTENSYQDIDRTALDSFEACGNGVTTTVTLERPTQRLVYRRRCFMSGAGESLGTVLIVGWQETVDGVSRKSLLYVRPDGSVELGGSKDDMELLPQEV